MVLFTLITILIAPNLTFRDFDFRSTSEKLKYFNIVWLTFVLVIGGMFVFNILYMNLLPNIFGNSDFGKQGFKTKYTIFSSIISIVIWSSFA